MPRVAQAYTIALLVVLLVVIGLARSFSSSSASPGKKPLPVNPDVGLSDEERMEKIAKFRVEFDKRIEEWFATFDFDSLDLASLERQEMMALHVPPSPDLPAAVSAADAIVLGRVTEVAFDPSGTIVSLTVEQTLKGLGLSRVIRVRQGSGLWPTPDWKGATISDDSGDPLLLPGQRALLFLDSYEGQGAEFEVQSMTGHYRLRPEGIQPVDLNPFANAVRNEPEAAFTGRITALVQQSR